MSEKSENVTKSPSPEVYEYDTTIVTHYKGPQLKEGQKAFLAQKFPTVLGDELVGLTEDEKMGIVGYQIYNVCKPVCVGDTYIIGDDIGTISATCQVYPGPNVRRHYQGDKQAIEADIIRRIEMCREYHGSLALALNLAQFPVEYLRQFLLDQGMRFHVDKDDPEGKRDHVIYTRLLNKYSRFSALAEDVKKKIRKSSWPPNVRKEIIKLERRHAASFKNLLDRVSPFNSFKVEDIDDPDNIFCGAVDFDDGVVGGAGIRVGAQISIATDLGVMAGEAYRRAYIGTASTIRTLECLWERTDALDTLVVTDAMDPNVVNYIRRYGGVPIANGTDVGKSLWVKAEFIEKQGDTEKFI